jgi:hypothetical protein
MIRSSATNEGKDLNADLDGLVACRDERDRISVRPRLPFDSAADNG